jgi:hypothetical protein
MEHQSRTVEEVLAALARRAHGIVTRRELVKAGVSREEIRKRMKKGLLIRQYPGVYRVGHAAPSVEAAFIAAVKACGEGAALSGRAAGYLLGLVKRPPPRPEVTAPRERRVEGIRTKRARRATIKVRGIPVTSVPETLVDLAAELPADELARACHEAGVKYGTTPRHIEAVLKRRPNARGAKKLRAIMSGETPVTLSEMERVCFEVLRASGLPLPEANRVASERRVDLRWPGRLTVELDSYRYHNSRHSWEQGMRRQREARARGEEFRRYSWTDVTEETDEMVTEIRRLLSSGSAPRSGAGR